MKNKYKLIVFAILFLSAALFIGIIGCGRVVNSPDDAATDNGNYYLGKNGVRTYGGLRSSSVQSYLTPGTFRSQSTSTISGYVYDAVTGNPVSGIKVYVNSSSLSGTSDAAGAYSVSGVPSGNVVVTAFCPTATYSTTEYRHVFDYGSVSVVTKANKIDFYLYPHSAYSAQGKGNVTITIKDSSGNPVEGAKAYVGHTTYKTFPDMQSGSSVASDSQGLFSIPGVTSGNILGTVGKAGLGGAYMTSPTTLSSGGTASTTITIPSNQGTLEGTVTLPSGFTLSTALLFPQSNYLSFWYMDTASVDATASTYSVMGPAGGGYKLFVNATGANSTYSTAFISNITLGNGTNTTNNVTLYDPPQNTTVSTSGASSDTYANISWSAPSSWSPDGYIVNLYSYDPYIQWFGITTGTSISIPNFGYNPALTSVSVSAIKTSQSMSLENFNLADFDFELITTKMVTELTVQPPGSSLEDRLNYVLSRDSRFRLYTESTSVSVSSFLTYCEANYGSTGTTSIVESIERAASTVGIVEQQFASKYNISKFAPEIRFAIHSILVSVLAAKADPIYIVLNPPNPSGSSTASFFGPVIAHEYGHFFAFYDKNGNQVIPTYTDPIPTYYTNMISLEVTEQNTKGYIERYHLGHITYIPWLTGSINNFSYANFHEYWALSELVANKVAVTLYGTPEMGQLFEALFDSSTPTQMSTFSDATLIAYLQYCKLWGITKWETWIQSELTSRGTTSLQQQSSQLNNLDTFYNSVQLLTY